MRRLRAAAAALVTLVAVSDASAPTRVEAQEAIVQESTRATVVVRQVAGATLYLDVGARHGLQAGDTIEVLHPESGDRLGRLVVTAATDTRSVLTFADVPFPVTRGTSLVLVLPRAPTEPAPEAIPPQPTAPPPGAGASPPAATGSSRPHGRIGIDLSASRSTTRVGSVDPEHVTRSFATPAFRFDATVPRAAGPFTLRLGGRLAYRYADGNAITPATSVRIYGASLERDVPGSSVRIVLGRFHSPVEAYSGYWDGALVRVGGPGLGIGALAGFEPDRWNEKPSAALPKVTAFADWQRRGRRWRWQGDVSAHATRPSGDTLVDRTFLGVSQRVSAGRFRLSQDLQVDRDPGDVSWRVSHARVRTTLALGRNVDVRVGASRRESWLRGTGLGLFAPRTDRMDGGILVRGRAGTLSLDASRSRDLLERESTGVTASASLRRLPGSSSLGASGVVSRFSGPFGTTLAAHPSLDVDLSPARLRFGYRFHHSDYLERAITSHAADAALDLPFGAGLRLSARARVQWGSYLSGQSVDLSLYRIF